MNEICYLLAASHNGRIAKDIEDKLNSFVEAINRAGGKCWLQSKSNKEHYYELTEPVSFNYYAPICVTNDTQYEVCVNNVTGIVKENENAQD